MSARARLTLDAGLFAVLLVAYYPSRTGLAVHEWLSLAITAPLLVHLVLNWDWVVKIVARFAYKLRSVSRLNFVVDVLLFVAAVSVVLSGLVVSRSIARAFGIATNPSVIWYAVHSVSAEATLVLMLVHLGLHWRWIARVVGQVSARPGPIPQTVAPVMPATNAAPVDWRDT